MLMIIYVYTYIYIYIRSNIPRSFPHGIRLLEHHIDHHIFVGAKKLLDGSYGSFKNMENG